LVDSSETAISKYHETFLSIAKFRIKHAKALAMQIIENNLRTVRNPLFLSWCPEWHLGGMPQEDKCSEENDS
jgi:hypothetical protein